MSANLRDVVTREYERAAASVSSAVAGLTPEQASREDIEGWSVKDHITHLTFWHELRFFEIGRVANGAPQTFPRTDGEIIETLNQTFVGLRRRLSFQQALADLEFARGKVLQAIAEAPEARLDPDLYEEMSPVGGAQHELAHAETIANWREREGI